MDQSPRGSENASAEGAGICDQYQRLMDEAGKNASGGWSPSPVEAWKEHVTIAGGEFAQFRRNWISGGTLNFPDRPKSVPLVLRSDDFSEPDLSERVVGYAYIVRRLYTVLRALPPSSMQLFLKHAIDDGAFGGRLFNLPGIGNVSEASLRQSYYVTRIARFLSPESTILEIGGGYGGLAKRIMDAGLAKRYILVDLPLNLALELTFLTKYFPDSTCRLWFEDDMIDARHRLICCAPWRLGQIDLRVDLVVNTASFQHMTLRNLTFYAEHFQRMHARKLFHLNRTVQRDPTDVVADDYPFRRQFTVLERRTGFLGRNTIEEVMLRA